VQEVKVLARKKEKRLYDFPIAARDLEYAVRWNVSLCPRGRRNEREKRGTSPARKRKNGLNIHPMYGRRLLRREDAYLEDLV